MTDNQIILADSRIPNITTLLRRLALKTHECEELKKLMIHYKIRG